MIKKFEFISPVYQWFLWIALAISLTYDFILLIGKSLETINLPEPYVIGIIFKLLILLLLLVKKGPIKAMLIFLSIMLIMSGFSGYHMFITERDLISNYVLLTRLIHLFTGIFLLTQLNKSIEFK